MRITVDAKISRIKKDYSAIGSGERVFIYCKYSSVCEEGGFNYKGEALKGYDMKEIDELSMTKIFRDLKESIIDDIKSRILRDKKEDKFDAFHNRLMDEKNFTFDFEL